MSGLKHGYPTYVSVDERRTLSNVHHFLQQETLEPVDFNYPAFFSYIFGFAVGIGYLAGGFFDAGSLACSLDLMTIISPVQIVLYGRIVSALFGTALIYITYALGRSAYDRTTGLGAALFVACSSLLLWQSNFALPDVAMAFWSSLAYLFFFSIMKRGTIRDYLLAGLFAGLAVSTKYNAGMILLSFVASHILRAQKTATSQSLVNRCVLVFSSFFLLGFISGSPYWIFSFSSYLQLIEYEAANMQFSLHAANFPLLNSLYAFLKGEWLWAAWVLLGCLYALHKRTPADWVIHATVIPAALFIGSWPKGGMHYLIFIYPLLGILAARFAIEFARKYLLNTGLMILFLCSVPNFTHGLRENIELAQEDLRVSAANWIGQNIPAGSLIASYWPEYCPPIWGSALTEIIDEVRALNIGDETVLNKLDELQDQYPVYRLYDLFYYSNEIRLPESYRNAIDLKNPKTVRILKTAFMDQEMIQNLRIQYILLPEAAYGRFLTSRIPAPGTIAHYHFVTHRDFLRPFFDESNGRYELVKIFESDGGQQGSKILLLKVVI